MWVNEINKNRSTLPDVFVSSIEALDINYKSNIVLDGENIIP